MNSYLNRICFLLIASFAIISCKKSTTGALLDLKPAIPVTVQNAVDYRPEPTVTASISGGGAIQIVLSIPSNSGRTIREITKVAASTSYTQIQSTATTGFYTSAPIAGNGTTVTFNTSLSEYTSKTGGKIPSATSTNPELSNKFYFLITLDDGSTIVTEPVKVLVIS